MLRYLKRMLASRKRQHASRQRAVFAFGVRECERLEERNLLAANNVFASGVSPLDADSGQITGTLWNDVDGDGIRSNADTGLSGWSVFLDSNRNGLYEIGEFAQTTDASGFYTFNEVPVGAYVLSAQLAEGWDITTAHDAVRTESEASSASAHLASPDPVSSDSAFASEHVPGQLIVKLTDATLADPFVLTALRDKQLRLGHETLNVMQSGLELWDVGPDLMTPYILWSDDPRIAFIEPNYTFTIAETVPDDEQFENMWALDNTGQTGGLIDADIDAPEAWDLQTGSTDVVIGVIDSGIDYTHPDLAGNIWTNPGEIAGNGIDDDDNGYIDDIHGWDFSSGDADPLDGHGHGTHVAGTIAAAGNNEIGVAGVNWNAKLMPLRFLNDAGSGSIYHALRALEYATMMGAQITNNSWIGGNYSSSMQFAIDQANAAGSIYVVCAGNDRNDNDSTPTYPASFLGDNVITVAATTHADNLSSFSNFGEESVDLGAPGSSILSTKSGGGYTTKSGTSMATPHVAGVASLLLSKRPDLAPVEVRQAILQGTDSVESLSGKTVSGGRLNAYGALMEVAPANGQFVDVQASISVGTHFGIYSSTANPHTLVAILDDGDAGFSQDGFTHQSNSLVAAAYGGDNHNMRGGSGTASWTFTGLADGEYLVAATWFHKYDNVYNMTDAPFTIHDSSGTELGSAIVDQSNVPSEFTSDGTNWDTLATVNVTGGILTVTLSAGSDSNLYSVADAVRIERTATVLPSLTLSIDKPSISEAAGPVATTATVTRSDTSGDLTVHLATDDTSEATVPSTVIIPAGATSTTFDIDAIDDTDNDGTQTVLITAAASGYIGTSDAIEVTDNEVSFVAILDDGDAGFSQDGFTHQSNSLVAAAYGGDNHNMRGGSGTASWTFTGLADGEYLVAATWFHKYDNVYNMTDAPFTIHDSSGTELGSAIVDQSNVPSEFTSDGTNWDTLATVNVTGGILTVTLSAGSDSNLYSVADAVRIERTATVLPSLTLSIDKPSISEAAGPVATTATVTRSDTSGDLTVHLATDDTSEATVPSTVIIPAGATSTTFDIDAIDDTDNDGTQTVLITAAASGYIGTSDAIEVTDNEVSFVAILDDGDAGFSQDGFTHQSNSLVAAAYGGDNHNMRGGSGTASWTFTGLADGEYLVAATWFHKYDNVYNMTDAPFTIHDSSGTELGSAIVDQSNVPSEFTSDGTNWDTLATVNVTGGILTVTLSAGSDSNLYSVADAVRIERTATVLPSLTLSIDKPSISEAAGPVATTATVTRSDTSGDLTVHLATDDTSEATVPSTVIIPAGATSTTFDIDAIDDTDNDGTQTVLITAAASGYIGTSDAIEVTDNEVSFVAILDDGDAGFSQDGFTHQSNSLVAAAYGGDNHNMRGGSGTASWTFTGLADGEYLVAATWFHKYDNVYNMTDAPFTIHDSSGTELGSAIVDQSNVPSEFTSDGTNWDTLATVNVTGGILTVTLSAGSDSNLYSVADAVRIERTATVLPSLTLSIDKPSISEAAGPVATTATVTRSDTSGNLTVHLATDDTSEATVPSTVIIPAGATSTTFDIDAIDDTDNDGTQTVLITAAASGYIGTSDAIEVTDNEVSFVAILDDGDAGFSQDGFTHQSNSLVAAAYGGDNHNMRGGSGTASWTFTGLADGEYLVAATWFHKYDNVYNMTDAPFTIHDSSGTELGSAIVDQSNVPSEFTSDGTNWDTLATVNVTGGILTVTLSAGSDSNRYSVADAIRIERLGSNAADRHAADLLFCDYRTW